MMTKKMCLRQSLLLPCLALLMASTSLMADDKTEGKQKLKIVLLMGQSNMVGYAHPSTAWYLTQPMYVPPAKTATVHGRYFNWDEFYWSGVRFATGSKEFVAKGKALLDERGASRKLWRDRVYGDTGYNNDWKGWKKEWGPRPGDNGEGWRGDMQNFLHKKAEEEGLYKRMVEHIESPENKLHPKVAIELMARRDKPIADDIKRVREIFLKGVKATDFDKLDNALEPLGKITAENRAAYARLLKETINLPIAKRTYISAFGAVAGEDTEYAEYTKTARGPLTVGYALWPTSSGPEYPFGISFERMVDGPVLLIKCSWGGTSLHTDWRPPSLATEEKPMGERLKWSLDHIQEVLADPGKYHPDYDPEAGYEMAGLVWFQGWNDAGNTEYGDQLVHFIKDFRKTVKAPELPVICGLLGHVGWKLNTFDGPVNSGMLYASKHPDLKGTVDVVNTVKYMPIELGLMKSIKAACGEDSEEYKEAERIISRATSKDGTHYYGSAKFMYLTGDAMARKLANLMGGGEPTIFAEAAELGVRD
ncbi:MAG: sialate O-acetylesterase [Lentisphaeria bacterium]|nr:sialate O-acetylesterase [Lentisphaeria bacterium]